MKRSLLVFSLIAFVLMVFVAYSDWTNKGSSNDKCPLMALVKVNEENFEVIGKFDGTVVLRAVENKGLYIRVRGYYVKVGDGKTYRINSSSAYFFTWGFVASIEDTRTMNVPFVIVNITRYETNVTVLNKIITVNVKRLVVCSYEGKLLWSYELKHPYYYYWTINYGSEMSSKEGLSYPQILISNTSNYLFVVEIYSAPREMSFVRRWVGDDFVYIFGKQGLIKKLSLGENPWPKRNVFVSSAGNYTILGFEQPQGDGSPAFGRVLIFSGTEVIFDKIFPYDPNCLCHVIPGWGHVNEDGYAVFGLYTGVGIYNGTFTYREG
ncbi:hypothetical protein [Pyrococcus yayanosii]|uniref:Uncharacterized protein n=1 Tax=Pyrococcus yayanosii (strain CH1 / JCM 16557) TaxID=529709 RepID=F8AJE2_PYRYC|nr:hypothetical protein [Pyrococcus yayanosii]AEH24958.1 hypothetical protein PYCH_12860 [Pyrococcus yayanosii CH1]